MNSEKLKIMLDIRQLAERMMLEKTEELWTVEIKPVNGYVYNPPRENPSISDIKEVVSAVLKVHNITEERIMKKGKKQEVTWCRFQIIAILNERFHRITLKNLLEVFKGALTNHTSVLNAKTKHTEYMNKNMEYRELFEKTKAALK